jgi:hypothetical protein
VLEVLDIQGRSILKHTFPAQPGYAEQLGILAFSRSGEKLALFYKEEVGGVKLLHHRLCFNTKTETSIELPMSQIPRIQIAQFTADEQRLVARLPGINHTDDDGGSFGGSSIVVWNLEVDKAHMTYLFKDLDSLLTFSYIPRLRKKDPEGQVIIVTSEGVLRKQEISQEWSDKEEADLRNARKLLSAEGMSVGAVVDGGAKFLLSMCSGIGWVMLYQYLTRRSRLTA